MQKLSEPFNLEGYLFAGMDGAKAFLTDQIQRRKKEMAESGDFFRDGDIVDAFIAAAWLGCEQNVQGGETGQDVLDSMRYAHFQLGMFINNLSKLPE